MTGLGNLGMVGSLFTAFGSARGAGASIFQLIDNLPVINPLLERGIRPKQIYGNLELRNVWFDYPCRRTVPVSILVNLCHCCYLIMFIATDIMVTHVCSWVHYSGGKVYHFILSVAGPVWLEHRNKARPVSGAGRPFRLRQIHCHIPNIPVLRRDGWQCNFVTFRKYILILYFVYHSVLDCLSTFT